MGILDAPSYSRTQADRLFGYASMAPTCGPAGLPAWKRALALSILGQSPARVLCLGDSTTAGVSADSYNTTPGTSVQDTANAYPRQLAKRLTALGVPADVGMTMPGSAGGPDAHWANVAGGVYGAGGGGIGGGQSVNMPAVGDGWNVTPGVLADTYKVWYWTASGTGTFSAQATGGTLVSVNTNTGTQGIASATVTAASASTANVVQLRSTVAGVGSIVFAIEFWNSATPNRVRILPAGCPGQDSGAFATGVAASASYGSRYVTRALAPNLTIISLGINDVYHGLSLATTQSNLAALAADAQLSGDALFMSAVPPSAGNVNGIDVSSINAWLLGIGGAYVDLQSRYARNMNGLGLQVSDKIHPNALGYYDMANVVADALLR